MDPRVQAMADILINYSLQVKAGQWIVIETSLLGEPMAEACAEAVLRAGANPSVVFSSEHIQELNLRLGNEEQLRFISPFSRATIEDADGRLAILAPINTRVLSSIDPARMAIVSKARESLLETMMRRTTEGTHQWCLAAYPTEAAAQDAGMSLREYEEFVFGAALLSEPDPVEAWRRLQARQQRLVEYMEDKDEIHVIGPGTDLVLSATGRTWVNDSGHRNFPGGEIFTGPVEDSANGHISFNFPAFLAGQEASGVQLTFRNGVVTEAAATENGEFLDQMLSMDDGARRLGEFAIGTNPGIQRFTKNTLFDEKIGGTLHMAVGRSIPETGGENISALHWDMVYDLRRGAEIRVDGELFSRNGEILVAGFNKR